MGLRCLDLRYCCGGGRDAALLAIDAVQHRTRRDRVELGDRLHLLVDERALVAHGVDLRLQRRIVFERQSRPLDELLDMQDPIHIQFKFSAQHDEDDDECDGEDDLAGFKTPLDPWGEMFVADEDEDDSSDDEDNDMDLDDLDQSDEEEEEDASDPDEHDDVKNFRREVIESIERGGDTDNLVLEINGSKHAWNITLSEVGIEFNQVHHMTFK